MQWTKRASLYPDLLLALVLNSGDLNFCVPSTRLQKRLQLADTVVSWGNLVSSVLVFVMYTVIVKHVVLTAIDAVY